MIYACRLPDGLITERENKNMDEALSENKESTATAENSLVDGKGSLLLKILLYTLPVIASGVLQLLFNAADVIVVGRFSGDAALAAVGSTGALINLIVNLMTGLSVGASVSVAHAYGEKNDKVLSDVVHTSMLVSVIGGIMFGIIGFVGARTFLGWMATPDNVIDLSTLYMRIYFIGVPIMMIYNFGASILRSIGDTKHPLIFLAISGVLNVFLNLFFVIVLGMSVDGVAYATVISQALSATLVVIFLMRAKGAYRLVPSKLRIHKHEFIKLLRVGIPAGLQGTVFSLSNVVIQSSVNAFGKIAMAGCTAASNIEGFIYVSMNSYYHAAVTFVGQNVGAGHPERIRKVMMSCMLLVTITGGLLGAFAMIFRRELLGIYCTENPLAIEYGIVRMTIISTTYVLCGIMDSFTGCIRGMGNSLAPMIIAMVGACGSRILWINTVYAWYSTTDEFAKLFMLFICYPVSWLLTVLALIVCFEIVRKNLYARMNFKKQTR